MTGIVLLEFSVSGVVTAGIMLGVVGLVIGILLGLASKKLAVPIDTKTERIREALRGSNCGGCSYAGCDACATAIAAGEAPIDICAGSRIDVIAQVMGVEDVKVNRRVAFVRCSGTCDKTRVKYRYMGIADCRKLALIPGHGEKECIAGCMGYGSCVSVCEHDAIKVVNGVAQVFPDRCIGCGACAAVCPNALIELRPLKDTMYGVGCSSKEKGKTVKAQCDTGCIGCGICARQCEAGAIEVVDNLARIDYDKCTGCGKCAEKCPQNIIRRT